MEYISLYIALNEWGHSFAWLIKADIDIVGLNIRIQRAYTEPLLFPYNLPILERGAASNNAKDAETFCTFAHIRGTLSVNEAACRLMEVALPMLAEQLSQLVGGRTEDK